MRKLLILLVFLATSGILTPLTSQAQNQEKMARLMADKLRNAQALLEGLVTRNFTKITRSAEELAQLSKTAEWIVLRTPQYDLHSNEFRRAVETIVQKSKQKNIDGVALAYVDMTLSCVRCHDYVREVREARRPGRGPALARELELRNR
jgi:hypothetical protein